MEPKTFFANERTFLAWLNISVLIMLTGLSLLGGTFSSLAGSSACSSTTTSLTSDGVASPPASVDSSSAPSTFHCKAGKVGTLNPGRRTSVETAWREVIVSRASLAEVQAAASHSTNEICMQSLILQEDALILSWLQTPKAV